MSLDDHLELMDNVLLWLWLEPKLEASLDGAMMARLQSMFMNGCLEAILG